MTRRDLRKLLGAWAIGFGLGVGLLIVFYGMIIPAEPFVYVGF